MDENGPRTMRGDTRPVPDPTLLTTQQLVRESAALREVLSTRLEWMEKLLDRSIAALRSIVETRLDSNDKAIELLQAATDRLPARIDEKIAHLREVHDEMFRGIQRQFTERDVRTDQSAKDSKIAVDAALQAAKEAVTEQNKSSALAIGKSETSTSKQIDQLGIQLTSSIQASDDKINDLKDRLTRIEGENRGGESAANKHGQSASFTVALIGMIVGGVVGIAGIVLAVVERSH